MAIAATRKGPRLLEREPALDTLRDSLEEARKGHGRLVLVVGEAGVGKSAAVRAFCDESRASAPVLWGGCDPLFTPRPLGPFLDIAEASGGDLQTAVEQGPSEVAAALLRMAGERSATIAVIEDVHWADEATLDVVRLLGRKLGQAPLLLVATYRDDELDRVHPLRVVLGELGTQPHVRRLPIPPLSPEAVAELADAADVDAADLHRLTGGNPFYITEVLASGNAAIPSTVRDAVLARAARLTDDARVLLDAVAIASPRIELWLLETLAGRQVSALEECLTSGMLVERAGAVEFRHELARLAIEESLEPLRRLALHRGALAALAEPLLGEPDVARLAYHAEAAGDETATLHFAPLAAARAASLGAHREAAAQYARTLRVEGGLAPAERADLLHLRSIECYLTDDTGEAIEAGQEELRLRRALAQREEEGAALSWLSEILWCPGRTVDSRQAREDAVAVLEAMPPGSELAKAWMNSWYVPDVERALLLATDVGDRDVALRALCVLGNLRFTDGGRETLEQCIGLAVEEDRFELVGWAYPHAISAAIAARQYGIAATWADAAVDYCSERGLELYRFYALGHKARLQLDLGRWDDAAETASAVLQIRRVSILPRIWGLVVLGLVRARRGDPGPTQLLDEAWELGAPTDELLRMGPAAVAKAEAAWLAGDRDGVVAATEQLFRLALDRSDPRLLGELALWRRRAGIDDDVPSAVEEPYATQLAGDWALAARRWRELGCPYEAALALADAVEEEPLRQALEELQRLGARPAASIVARRLQQGGVRNVPRGPRISTLRNEPQLTVRELDVLPLLAEGLRNAAIADRLFVSPRTVDHHVSAILRKLGAQNRGEAVAEAARLGLLHERQPEDAN
jgi:DNA-binding CsgD family transcriptional regulator